MELNFTEISNTQNPYENYDSYDNSSFQNQYQNQNQYQYQNQNQYQEQEQNIDSQKYWEQNLTQNKNLQQKKKKVSFTDILNNMNLVVNNQGVLQFMAPVSQVEEQQYSQQQQYQTQEPLDPSVKHSFIYNKYFKDYKDVTAQKEVKVP